MSPSTYRFLDELEAVLTWLYEHRFFDRQVSRLFLGDVMGDLKHYDKVILEKFVDIISQAENMRLRYERARDQLLAAMVEKELE